MGGGSFGSCSQSLGRCPFTRPPGWFAWLGCKPRWLAGRSPWRWNARALARVPPRDARFSCEIGGLRGSRVFQRWQNQGGLGAGCATELSCL